MSKILITDYFTNVIIAIADRYTDSNEQRTYTINGETIVFGHPVRDYAVESLPPGRIIQAKLYFDGVYSPNPDYTPPLPTVEERLAIVEGMLEEILFGGGM